MRFISLKDGRFTKIFTGLVTDQDDNITCFSSINSFNQFIIGTNKGNFLSKFFNFSIR